MKPLTQHRAVQRAVSDEPESARIGGHVTSDVAAALGAQVERDAETGGPVGEGRRRGWGTGERE